MLKSTAVFQAKKLKVAVDDKEIVHGLSIAVAPGEIHAIMGPNGAGKSTLAMTIAGHPKYMVTGGTMLFGGQDITGLTPDERARKGIFLAFQYPVEIPGVSVQNFLRAAYEARFGHLDSILEFRERLKDIADQLNIPRALLERNLNENFSGGEKKRLEILQMAVLKPRLAILDETDSGLDIDALRTIAKGVEKVIAQNRTAAIVITHYQRLLKYLKPDVVHVMVEGKIVESGGPSVARKLEKTGYAVIDTTR